MSEVYSEFTVDISTVSRWANRFRSVCVRIHKDPRPGRPRTSTDERSVKLVRDDLEDRSATCEELSRVTGAKTSQENTQEQTQLLVSGPLILYDNARPHIADVVTKKLCDCGWGALLHAPYSPDMSPLGFDLFPKS